MNDRLDKVQDEIDKQASLDAMIKAATEATEKAEASLLQKEVNGARDLVGQLPPGDLKADLTARLDAVQTKIDQQKEYKKLLDAATRAVEKADQFKKAYMSA